MKDCYCKLAEIGLSANNPGTFGICNQSRTALKTANGQAVVLNRNTIEEAWNSPTRAEILTSLRSGIRHESCNQCWVEEDAGRKSKRIQSNSRYRDVKIYPDKPTVIMLKPGNVCNLKCRHCNPQTSSRLISEYTKVELDYPLDNFKNELAGISNSYNKKNPVWDTLGEWFKTVEFLELYGAEPFLIPILWDKLEEASYEPNAKNVTLHINTNGIAWNDRYYDILNRFKRVYLILSIDGIGPQFEYMRHPAKWNDMSEILLKFSNFKDNPKFIISISVTLSILNIYYAYNILAFFRNQGINVGFNILYAPAHLNFRILPEDVKVAIVKNIRDDYMNIAELLKSEHHSDTKYFVEFWKKTKAYDKLRNESYEETFPEMYALLHDHVKDIEV
jgi:hypothetical protein